MLFFTSSGSRSSFQHNELSRPQGEACRGQGCSPRAKAAAGRATSPREAGRWHHLEAAELKLMQRDRSGAKLAQATRRRAGRREEGCAREVPAPAELGVSGEQQRDLRQLEYSRGRGNTNPGLQQDLEMQAHGLCSSPLTEEQQLPRHGPSDPDTGVSKEQMRRN